jgi:flagella basal body P-ring formation protein FlgA
MKHATFALAAALTMVATAAFAAPVLRSEVTVAAPVVTVGDMFEDAGSLAEKAMFLAPAPGTTGTVTLDAVRQAASIVGLTDYVTDGVLRVRVARAATVVDVDMLTALIIDDLRARGIVADGIVVEAAFERPDLSFNAEAVDNPVQLASLRYTPANGGFAARLLIAGIDAPVDLNGRIDLMVEAPHLAATRAAGTILAPDDIEMRLIPLKQAESMGVPSLDQLVGKQLTRQSRGGMLLKASDVIEPHVVERNAMVTVRLTSGPMTLTIRGQALNAAAVGQPVQVLNIVSKKILHGVALPNGAVDVDTSLDVASL